MSDAKIRGTVIEAGSGQLLVEITHPAAGGSACGQGINLSETVLALSALTAIDRANLTFISTNADLVELSFVCSSGDVEDLIAALDDLGEHRQVRARLHCGQMRRSSVTEIKDGNIKWLPHCTRADRTWMRTSSTAPRRWRGWVPWSGVSTVACCSPPTWVPSGRPALDRAARAVPVLVIYQATRDGLRSRRRCGRQHQKELVMSVAERVTDGAPDAAGG
ncbi:MAG: hypothetical protein ABJD68_02670 [Nakamurella sp.]